ncbi:lysostaphin resistance A-like protein [Streptomyces sp. NPDC020747]|uniref:lysostaphin resistance A-like protein n=1 Tax=Streptomyces sp. NPDC020747 TaxID=3365086 RepID=UPI0037A9CBA2
MNSATPLHHKSSLVIFGAVTFASSWGFWLIAIALGGSVKDSPSVVPYVLGGFGPVFGAIVVRVRRSRRREAPPARAVGLRTGMRLHWVLPLLVMASATVLAAALLSDLLGGPAMSFAEGRSMMSDAGGAVPFFVSMLIAGPLSEEPGWRGTAHPRLRASFGRFQAGLLLGVVWAIWHLPLFFVSGTLQEEFGLISWSGPLFALSVIPMAFLTAYAYDRAGVVASIAVHFGVNATIAMLTVKSPVTPACIVAVQTIVAIILLTSQRDRRADLPVHADTHPRQTVTGTTEAV